MPRRGRLAWRKMSDWQVADAVMAPSGAGALARPGVALPVVTDRNSQEAQVRRQGAREELARRGYTSVEVRRLAGGDWSVLHSE
jgi:hypothetical protein